jgi:hypothetical protein
LKTTVKIATELGSLEHRVIYLMKQQIISKSLLEINISVPSHEIVNYSYKRRTKSEDPVKMFLGHFSY